MGISTRKQTTKAVSPPVKKDHAGVPQVMTQRALSTPTRVARATASLVERTVVPESPIPHPSVQSAESLARAKIDETVSAADYFPVASKPSSTVPKFNFAKLGVKVSKAPKRGQDKNSTLRIAVIKNKCILFRIAANDPTMGSWAEKIMMDEIKKPSDWVTEMHLDSYVFSWFQNNVKMLNNKGYGIRMFALTLEDDCEPLPDDTLLAIGNHICEQLNANEKNNTVVTIVPEEYFWIRDATWEDVIGYDAALNRLQYNTVPFFRGYYQQYKGIIHEHFRDHTFSLELARTLHAPLSAIHPDALAAAAASAAVTSNDSEPSVNGASPSAAFAPGFKLGHNDDDEVIDLQNKAGPIKDMSDDEDIDDVE